MSAEDLQTCIGLPDQRTAVGKDVQILTYFVSSPTNGGVSITVPIIGGISLNGGGYCHATVKIQNNAVTEVRYTGEKDEIGAPNAICAPVVGACLRHPEHYAPVNTPFYAPEHVAKLEEQERKGR